MPNHSARNAKKEHLGLKENDSEEKILWNFYSTSLRHHQPSLKQHKASSKFISLRPFKPTVPKYVAFILHATKLKMKTQVNAVHRGFEEYNLKPEYFSSRGPGSSVGIATGYGLDGPGIESRWGVRFSAPVQNGPEAHPTSCTMGTGSFPGVKNGRGVTLTPHPLLLPWSWKRRAIPLLPLRAVRPVQSLNACTRVTFTLPFYYSVLGIIIIIIIIIIITLHLLFVRRGLSHCTRFVN